MLQCCTESFEGITAEAVGLLRDAGIHDQAVLVQRILYHVLQYIPQVFRLSDMLAREQTSDEANSIPCAADQQDQQSRGAASAANQVEMTAAATQQLQQLDISNSQRTSSAGALSLPPSTSHGSANSSRTLPHHPKVQASMSSRQHQQQQQESDAIPSDVSVMTPGFQGDTASDHAVIMEGDLNCEVNRYDLLQRGR